MKNEKRQDRDVPFGLRRAAVCRADFRFSPFDFRL
jgi:hypothetical protein